MENENVVADNSNQQEDEVLETSNETEETEQDTTDWKAKAQKLEEIAENQRIRAEKAEKLNRTIKDSRISEPSSKDLSVKDSYALMEAKVPLEDIDEVVEFAKFKKISVAEALKAPMVKGILADKAEQRQSAAASNTTASKRGSGKITDEMLLERARKGEMPDSEEDIARLFRIRKGINK